MRALVTAALCSILVASGCAKVPQVRYYDLAGNAGPAGSATDNGFAIGVREFLVDPPYDQERLVYREGEMSPEVGFYAYHRWASPLSRMLPTLVSRVMAQADDLQRTEPYRNGRSYDAMLGGRLIAFEELDLGGAPHVRVELVLHLENDAGRSLWTHRIGNRRAVPTDDVEQLVSAIRSILVDELSAVRPDVVAALR